MADFADFSRFDALRHVIPGAYGLLTILFAVSVIQPGNGGLLELTAEWLVAALLASFVLGYMFHLFGMYLAKLWTKNAEKRRQSARKIRSNFNWEGHHVELALESQGPCSWILEPEIRAQVLAKFNRLSKCKYRQADLDARSGVRWTVYHFCYEYSTRQGLGESLRTNRSELEMLRSFVVALLFGTFVGVFVYFWILGKSVLTEDTVVDLLGRFRLAGLFIAATLLLAALMGRPLMHQVRRMSIRLAGSVYEAFLAS